MKEFTLVLNDTPTKRKVVGESISDACQKAGLSKEDLETLDCYIDDGSKVIQVFGEADCDCMHHAQNGITCIHDLERVGINYIANLA